MLEEDESSRISPLDPFTVIEDQGGSTVELALGHMFQKQSCQARTDGLRSSYLPNQQ